jgi:hypothetical protein
MKILFCVPGNRFSDLWLHGWNETIAAVTKAGHTWGYSMAYDPVVYYARNRVLGGDNTKGKSQKPFQGSLQYDYIVWIDSDIVWHGEDVLKLIAMDKPIAAGCYVMANNNEYPIVETLDYNKLLEQGTFKFMDRAALAAKSESFKVSYVGFGFVAIKAGVIETMEYPWFRPRWVDQGNFHDFTAEDVGFCWTAAELGHEIWVDPRIRVGHEKTVVLG